MLFVRRMAPITAVLVAVIPSAIFAACSSSSSTPVQTSDAGSPTVDGGAGDTAIAGISSDNMAKFLAGEAAFNLQLEPADGLGPLYTKKACAECHQGGIRGPGAATKMAVVGSDGFSPAADQSLLPFGNTEHPLVVTDIPGAHTPILPPFDGGADGGADAGELTIKVTTRLGPPIFGRGYLEAVEESEIERMEALQAGRTDGIHGHVNHLPFTSQPNPDPTFDSHQTGDIVIGRFGLKARISTLDEFSADALQGDMGITSPMRTSEFTNPDGVTDDLKSGVDMTVDAMNARGMYVRLLAIPTRGTQSDIGRGWFESCNCQVCHVESLRTRPDFPVPQLAGIDAPIFSDMLLHDMGDDLADGVAGGNEGAATARDWRTAPLIGERVNTSFLHDGRAATIRDAIMMHGGNGSEAAGAAVLFNKLAPSFQQNVIDYVNDL